MSVSPEELVRRTTGRTLLHLLRDRVTEYPDAIALRWKEGDSWRELTWQEYLDTSLRVAGALRSLGVKPGDRVALLLRNRPEHCLADMGALLVGATPVSFYLTSSAEQIQWLLRDSQAVVILVDGPAEMARVAAVRESVGTLRTVVALDGTTDVTWQTLVSGAPVDLDEALAVVSPSDIATIIYTSGTTGFPKAAQHSHAGINAAVESLALLLGEDFTRKRVISYMPMAHIAERVNGYYTSLRSGHVVSCCPDVTAMAGYVFEVRPQFFFGPPRIWEKLWGAVSMVAALAEGDDKAAYDAALEVGRRAVVHGRPLSSDLQAEWDATDPARTKLRASAALDGMEVALTAAATLSTDVLDGLAAVGVTLADFYGMTEFAGGTGDPYTPRRGTLGRPFPGVEVRIAEDGEIELRGPHAFVGYAGDPAKTAEVLTDDGWVRTGDLGRLDEDGYLYLTGRKKDLIITSGGKNIAPAPLENALVSHPLISTAIVVGEARNYLAALVLLDPMGAADWAKSHAIEGSTVSELAVHPLVIAEVERHVASVNDRFARVEQIKRVKVLDAVWGPDSEELTPTMKLKRDVVSRKYAGQIAGLYE